MDAPKRTGVSARRAVLPAMAALLAAYVVAHSPLVRLVGRLVGRHIERCYFTCSGWAPYGRPVDAAAAILALVLTVGAAWIVAGRLPERGADRLLSFGLLTPTFVVVPASLLGVAGWVLHARPLRPPLGPLLTALPGALVLALGIAQGWWRPLGLPPWRPPPRIVLLLATTVAILLAASTIIGLVHPPTSYDALSYHAPLAVYFWRDGNLGILLEQQNWAWALAQPGTEELWAGLFRVAGGEHVANLAQLPFALLGAVAVYRFSRHTGLRSGAAALGGLGFLSGPLVVMQVGMQRNDVMGGAFILTAAALAAAPAARWGWSRLLLIGIGLGLAAVTKLSMLPAVAAVALYLLAMAIRAGRLRELAAAAGAFAIVVSPWWVRNLMLYGNPIYPAALPLLGRGIVQSDFPAADLGFVPTRAAWLLYPLLEPHSPWSGFGALFAMAALPGIGVAAVWGRRAPMALYGLLVAAGLPVWWILTRHEVRFLIDLFGLSFAFLGWSLVAVPRNRRRMGAWLLAAATVFSAAVTADQALRPYGQEPTARFEFYDRVWGVDSVASGLPEDQALVSHTGFALLSYAADYPLLGPGLGRRLVTIDGELPTDSIIGLMLPRRIRYVYVPAAPESQRRIAAMYPADRFDLIHSSLVREGDRQGTRRYLFRLREPGDRPRTGASTP
jgi:hypothetical protein